MNNSYFSLNPSNWAEMLYWSNKNQNHILYDSNRRKFYIAPPSICPKDKTIKKLNLHEIIENTKKIKFNELCFTDIYNVALSLNEMANKAEKKHFSGIKRILKIFNFFLNGFSGWGFHTTISEAKKVANQLFAVAYKSRDAVASVTDQGINSTNQPNKPIVYIKGQKKTNDLIPAKKAILGKGHLGTVHEHQKKPSIVIKKTFQNIEHEYKLGFKLHHPNLVKIHNLYIKRYDHQTKYKLVMDKVTGKTLNFYYSNSTEKISNEIANKLLLEAQNCCLYLFDQQVGWRDVNDGNIFVTQDTNSLMIVDFERWCNIENSQERTTQLLLGSMEIVGWIIKSSSIRAGNAKNVSLERQIIFPKIFFPEEQSVPYQVISNIPFGYSSEKWMQGITTRLATMTEEQMKEFLKNYFEQVKMAFQLFLPTNIGGQACKSAS